MSTEENKALVRRAYEEFINQRNLDRLGEFFAPDYVGHVPGMPDIQGIEGLKQVAMLFFSAFPDLHVTLEDVIAEGDKLSVRHTWRGTHQGELMGVPPTGKEVTFIGIDVYHTANGKLKEEWSGLDMLGLLQQLGAIPGPGQGGG